MKLGEVFQSIEAWRKLSSIPLSPKLAYQILKYFRLVTAEYEIAEKQRTSLIHEITNTKDGEDARIEPNTPEFLEYVKRVNEVMETEVSLEPAEITFGEVINSVDEKNEVLSIQDLSVLEPFFKE